MARYFFAAQKSLMRHLQKRGVYTTAWVVNTEEEFQEIKEMYGECLDGVMTDRPELLNQFIEEKCS